MQLPLFEEPREDEAEDKLLGDAYRVIVRCKSEDEQHAMVARLRGWGWDAEAVIA